MSIANLHKLCYYRRKSRQKEVSYFEKKEILFIGGILVIAVVLWAGMSFFRKGDYGTIRIMVDGVESGTYSLGENQVININDTNTCEIKNGSVRMIEATCPDKLCIKQKAVDNTGGTIICLPNKVIIEGEKTADTPAELDAVT